VRAVNEDGVWSEQPAAVDFEIPATFTQTLWFKALCVLAAAALLYLLYWYRLRVVTARLEERMEVRLAERERIARTLHDTFLQSVQGVVLRLDAAVDTLPDDSAARKTLSPVLDSARASITEGRAQVHELRSSDVDDVESSLREISALLSASYPGVAFALTVSGTRSVLRADVVQEISEIGREALRNAYQHAQATSIEVLLNYQLPHFALTVQDNGKGMPLAPVTGHWGLVGMRERADRIGARLEIGTAPENGVRVTLTVPASQAYAIKRSWWRRLRERFSLG
jgi:signal transduction histidine kinase